MLAQKIYIYEPISIDDGKYEVKLYFQNTTIPQYINLGDYIKDTDGNEYEIVLPTSVPFSDGNTATVLYKTTDVSPIEDSDYNSIIFTPGQVDVRPLRQSAGALSIATIYNATNYEYSVLAGWSDPVIASAAEVGDSIVDSGGKEFELTYIDSVNRFNVECRIKEVQKEAIEPLIGEATLYTPTINYGFFQGTEMQDPPRNVIQNRDRFLYDSKFKQLEESIINIESAAASEIHLRNETGSTINAITPVCSLSTGNISLITVATEAQAKAVVGVTQDTITTGNSGKIITSGLIKNITTEFSFGDVVFVSKTGGITNTPPEIDVGGFLVGDFVICIGLITKNSENPSNKDLLVNIRLMGQL